MGQKGLGKLPSKGDEGMRRVRNGKEEGKKRERRSNADNNNIGRMEKRKSKPENVKYDTREYTR